VELQIQLDEVREKYKAIARSTNAKAHNKKMQTLEYNLSQLNEVQRGVCFVQGPPRQDARLTILFYPPACLPKHVVEEGPEHCRAQAGRAERAHRQPRTSSSAIRESVEDEGAGISAGVKGIE
jgi:hypothetical protein